MFKPDYSLSKNQEQFIEDAESQGYDVDYSYSGRGMFGRECPSIRVESIGKFNTKSEICWDNMGLDFVIYAKD